MTIPGSNSYSTVSVCSVPLFLTTTFFSASQTEPQSLKKTGKRFIKTDIASKEGIYEEYQGFRDNRITKYGYAQREISWFPLTTYSHRLERKWCLYKDCPNRPYATIGVTIRFYERKHIYIISQYFIEKVPEFARPAEWKSQPFYLRKWSGRAHRPYHDSLLI